MANWSFPVIGDIYVNLLTYLKDRDLDAAKQLDSAVVTVTNPVTDMKRWNSTGNKWEKYSGAAWVDLTATYSINAATASALATGRTFSVTGDATGTSAAFTGAAAASIPVTLATVNASVGVPGAFGSATAVPVVTVDAKGRITAISTAALGSIATQSAAAVALTGGAISGTTLTLVQSISAAPTIEGRVEWDTDGDQLKIGTGAATKTFTPDDGTATITNRTFSTGCTWSGNTLTVAKGGTGKTTLTGIVKGNGTAAFTAAVAGTDYQAPLVAGVNYQVPLGYTPVNRAGETGITGVLVSSAAVTGPFTDQDTINAPYHSTVTQTGSTYAAAVKMRVTGAARTRTVSFGSLHNADNTIDAVIHGIDSADADNFSWRFCQNGDFVSSGNVTAYSDARLKKDLEIIPSALYKVMQLTGYTFTRIDSGARQTGLIAQDVQRVLPEAVVESGEYLGVAYGNMVGLLVEAIKDQQKQIDELKARVGA